MLKGKHTVNPDQLDKNKFVLAILPLSLGTTLYRKGSQKVPLQDAYFFYHDRYSFLICFTSLFRLHIMKIIKDAGHWLLSESTLKLLTIR